MRTSLSPNAPVSLHDKVSGYIAICPGPVTEADIALNCQVTRGQVRRTVAAMRASGGADLNHVKRVFG